MTNSVPERLPAKSAYGGKAPRSLAEHSFDAESAASEVFRLDGRWGQNFCRFFGLERGEDHERFLLHLRVAALFHDLGKANEEFVDMVLRRRQVKQTLRHEHISAFILCLPEVRGWLEHGGIDVDVVTAAVLSHHIKASAQDKCYTWGECQHSPRLNLWLNHPEVHAVLEGVQEVAHLPAPPSLPSEAWLVEAPPWDEIMEHGRSLAATFRRAIREDVARKRLHLAVKSALIVSDTVASALIREGHSVRDWVEDVVHRPSVQESEVRHNVIDPRCRAIAESSGRPFKWDDFQVRAAEQPARCLLLAACGAGKTLAAWRWAATQCDSSPLGKVVFLYPTRGTATEGFRDYVGWAPEADAALMHGTSRYELDGMLSNPSEALRDKDLSQLETEQRLFALGFWSKRFFSATVDQFLAFLDHRYESLCMLPVLADSAVIIDEVHSFSPQMFDKLVAFLGFFRGPVLCMTATLPRQRIERLKNCGVQVFPENGQELRDLSAKEQAPRYDIQIISGANTALPLAKDAFREGKRVLWVVNTVGRCQAIARELESALDVPVLVYHSRFLLEHRQAVHAQTVESFQQDAQPAIAVTTQVCEMSLDLDAHVLITELAPFPSLVQRFGRANRRLKFAGKARASVYVYEPGTHAPYKPEEIAASRKLLDSVCGFEKSQADLSGALDDYQVPEHTTDTARFLEAGYYATPGDFRESDDFGVQALLDCDVDRAREALRKKKSMDGMLLTVPRKDAWPAPANLNLPAFLHLADGSRYSPRLGFLAEGVTQ